ncbi:MAG: hypothetical protein ACI8W8_003395 [Rhodothermales bacterium]|jgi:hypothetical protein
MKELISRVKSDFFSIITPGAYMLIVIGAVAVTFSDAGSRFDVI